MCHLLSPASALSYYRVDGTQDQDGSTLRAARGSGDGCSPVLWSALGVVRTTYWQGHQPRTGVFSSSRPWGLITTVPVSSVMTHLE